MSINRTDCRLAASNRRALCPAWFQNGLGTRLGLPTSFAENGSATPFTATAPRRSASSKETETAAPARIDFGAAELPAAWATETDATPQRQQTGENRQMDRKSAKRTMRAGPLSRANGQAGSSTLHCTPPPGGF